jgi:hypothetical protein
LPVYSCTTISFAYSRLLATHPGKTKVAVSLSGTITQLRQSSPVPLSTGMVRDVIDVLSGAVPWFCRVMELGCTSSQSIRKENIDNRGVSAQNEVEGLIIFAKRDGRVIGREEVLKEFRSKRQQWEQS